MSKNNIIPPKNAKFNMSLEMYSDKYAHLSFEEKKKKSFAKNFSDMITIRNETSSILSDILKKYEFDGNVLILCEPFCVCGKKLKKKEIITKSFPLLGGGVLLLRFQTYTCNSCKKYIGLQLPNLFDKNSRYPNYIKEESVRTYLTHLSSYDASKNDVNRLYSLNLSKYSVRQWIKNTQNRIDEIPLNLSEFSGYYAYDEEYAKVYLGDVGVKGAKLKRVEVYIGLLRDTVTKKPIVAIIDSLGEKDVFNFLYNASKKLLENGVPIKGIVTDGKDEYNSYIRKLNQCFIREGLITKNNKIKHAYCVFHFKGNLYEAANFHWFGKKYSKEELPEHLINQIKMFDKVLDASTRKEALKELDKLIYEKNTFIHELRKQINRLFKFKEEYILHIEHETLKTSDVAENYFSITKPEKIKKGYKTKWGLNVISQIQSVQKFFRTTWLNKLKLFYDFEDSIELLLNCHKISKELQ